MTYLKLAWFLTKYRSPLILLRYHEGERVGIPKAERTHLTDIPHRRTVGLTVVAKTSWLGEAHERDVEGDREQDQRIESSCHYTYEDCRRTNRAAIHKKFMAMNDCDTGNSVL